MFKRQDENLCCRWSAVLLLPSPTRLEYMTLSMLIVKLRLCCSATWSELLSSDDKAIGLNLSGDSHTLFDMTIKRK